MTDIVTFYVTPGGGLIHAAVRTLGEPAGSVALCGQSLADLQKTAPWAIGANRPTNGDRPVPSNPFYGARGCPDCHDLLSI